MKLQLKIGFIYFVVTANFLHNLLLSFFFVVAIFQKQLLRGD